MMIAHDANAQGDLSQNTGWIDWHDGLIGLQIKICLIFNSNNLLIYFILFGSKFQKIELLNC